MHTNIRRSVIAFALLLLSLAAVRPIARAADEPARGDYVGQVLRFRPRRDCDFQRWHRDILAYVCDGTGTSSHRRAVVQRNPLGTTPFHWSPGTRSSMCSSKRIEQAGT